MNSLTYYRSNYSNRAFVACNPCKPGDWLCGAAKWGCDIQHTTAESVLGQSNAIQQNLGGTGKTLQDASYNFQKGAVDAGKTIYESVGGTSNAIQQRFGDFSKFLPFIGIGLGVILLIVLLKK